MTYIDWKTIDIVSKYKGKCNYELQRTHLLLDILDTIFEFSVINDEIIIYRLSRKNKYRVTIHSVIYFIQITLSNEVKKLLKKEKSNYTTKQHDEITYWSEMSRIYFHSVKEIRSIIDNVRIIYDYEKDEETDEDTDEETYEECILNILDIPKDTPKDIPKDIDNINSCRKIEPFKSISFGRGHVRYFENNKYYHGIGYDDHPYKTDKKHDKCLYHYYNTDIILNEHILWETEDISHYCTNCCVDWELSADKKNFNIYKCNGHSINK